MTWRISAASGVVDSSILSPESNSFYRLRYIRREWRAGPTARNGTKRRGHLAVELSGDDVSFLRKNVKDCLELCSIPVDLNELLLKVACEWTLVVEGGIPNDDREE